MFFTHLEIGHYVHEPLVFGSSCSLFGCTPGAMLGSTTDTCSVSSRVAFGRISDFLRDWVSRLLRSILPRSLLVLLV